MQAVGPGRRSPMKVVVGGASGLIGTALCARLVAEGHEVTRLVRKKTGAPGEVEWDTERGTLDPADLEGHDAGVCMAGAPIGDHKWTPEYKATIRDSRVNSMSLLARTFAALSQRPAVLACGSAIGYYGDRGDEVLTEESGNGTGFLAGVVRDLEAAGAPAEEAGVRLVRLRTGIVMTAKGGVLKKQLPAFRRGMGGRLGSGRQWLSWVDVDDYVAAIIHVLSTPEIDGAVNLTAPEPVTNAEYTHTLGHVLGRPTLMHVPALALEMMMGKEMVEDMIIASQRVLPVVLQRTGFAFGRPTIEASLRAALGK